jgi:Phosphoribosyl transferase/TRSP domain C terminus to PRTase_2
VAAMLPADLPEPVVMLGMAETATALGQGTFAAYRSRYPGKRIVYLQSSRQRVDSADIIARFEEGHSHATSHLVQIADPALIAEVAQARSLVIVDDECSTGQTFVAAARALVEAMPLVERIKTVCITDWSDRSYLDALPRPAAAHAIVGGSMQWTPGVAVAAEALAVGSNQAGAAPPQGMASRTGLTAPEAASRPAIAAHPGERILVLGEGEHSYEALRVAEEIEAQGGIAAVQCITRSPALLGGAMASVSRFADSYGSGAPCFLYNMLAHRPDRVVIVSEVAGGQVAEARAALAMLGASIPVDLLLCRYTGGADT